MFASCRRLFSFDFSTKFRTIPLTGTHVTTRLSAISAVHQFVFVPSFHDDTFSYFHALHLISRITFTHWITQFRHTRTSHIKRKIVLGTYHSSHWSTDNYCPVRYHVKTFLILFLLELVTLDPYHSFLSPFYSSFIITGLYLINFF